ncbi:MAG: hypothetical protein QJT80_06760 [Candidatus Thiocaldithrix dubininis]|uniref:Uncharacterized protein n=1 Tax=Candidatus Thiocaldithrix dubininis TaxID=3080823 RepID=A0AA95KLM2_9GAMM|nr:MAG: hypothetical protein QJT80_06760 [Candidatus Thiocaldithrix dubininis]
MITNPHTRLALQVTAWGGTVLTGYYGVASWYEVNPGLNGLAVAVLMFVMFAGATIGLSAVLFNRQHSGLLRLMAAVLLVALFGVDMWASSNHLQTAVLTSVVNANEYDSSKATQQATLNSLKAQLAACNPAHVSKCVKPLTEKITRTQTELNQLSNNSQQLSDKVISEKWQVIVEFMNLGKREGEQLSKVEAITHFFMLIGALIYILVIVAHGLLGSGTWVATALQPSPTPPLNPTGTDDDHTHPDYHHSRIGYNAPVTAHRNGSTPRAHVNTQAVSPSPYPPTPANDSAPKNLLTPSAAVQQRWGMQGNTALQLDPELMVVNRPSPRPDAGSDAFTKGSDTRPDAQTAVDKLNDPNNFSLLHKYVTHPKFADVFLGVVTAKINCSQKQIMKSYGIGGDMPYWVMVILEAFELVSEPSHTNSTRHLLKPLSVKEAQQELQQIQQAILGVLHHA